MKGHYLYIAMGLVWAGMLACTEDVPQMNDADESASRIYLSAGISETVSSRTPYYPTDDQGNALRVPTTIHPLNVSVWASTEEGKYPNNGWDGQNNNTDDDPDNDNKVAIHTYAKFQSGEPQLLGEAVYPKPVEGQTIDVHFVGLHPRSEVGEGGSKWSPSDDKQKAGYTFTGKEDVMFAPKTTGTYGLDYENNSDLIPTFNFSHLLTWLRVEIVADEWETEVTQSEKISKAWGKVKSLTIKSKNQVVVDLTGDKDDVTFGGEELWMKFYHIGTDNEFSYSQKGEGYQIPYTAINEVAYVMCAPVVGEDKDGLQEEVPEYTLHLVTENRELDIPIDLKNSDGSYFTESTMGKQFTIQLKFKMGNVITVLTEIKVGGELDWYTHGTGTGDLTEENLSN